jgi:hypothetical protein
MDKQGRYWTSTCFKLTLCFHSYSSGVELHALKPNRRTSVNGKATFEAQCDLKTCTRPKPPRPPAPPWCVVDCFVFALQDQKEHLTTDQRWCCIRVNASRLLRKLCVCRVKWNEHIRFSVAVILRILSCLQILNSVQPYRILWNAQFVFNSQQICQYLKTNFSRNVFIKQETNLEN